MSNLTEFLLARIAEDEHVAQMADAVTDKVEDDWQDVTQPITNALTQGRPQEHWAKRYGHAYEHISRHDPARVLAECQAKRRIALREQHRIEYVEARGEEWAYSYAVVDLASVYADHPDYRPEWRI